MANANILVYWLFVFFQRIHNTYNSTFKNILETYLLNFCFYIKIITIKFMVINIYEKKNFDSLNNTVF